MAGEGLKDASLKTFPIRVRYSPKAAILPSMFKIEALWRQMVAQNKHHVDDRKQSYPSFIVQINSNIASTMFSAALALKHELNAA